jgi:trimeric autotransporter adhesin
MTRTKIALLASVAGCTLLTAPLEAVVVPSSSAVRDKEFRNPALYVPIRHMAPSGLRDKALGGQLAQELAALGIAESSAFYDVGADRWGSLILSVPLIPGAGVGNTLRWSDTAAPRTDSMVRQEVWARLNQYLERHQKELRIDRSELGSPSIGILDGGALVHVVSPRRVAGVLVRDSVMVAVINHGNLVLLGFQNWASALGSTDPSLSPEQAKGVVSAHVAPFSFKAAGGKPHLELLPLSRPEAKAGYDFRLVWVVGGGIDGDLGTWEGLVDAANGELLAFVDRNQYAKVKKVMGGVYPVSNDQVPPDGVEVPGMSMPYADVRFPDGTLDFANSSGVIGCGGNPGPGGPPQQYMRTTLSGRFVRMNDGCGPVNEKSLFNSDLNFDLGFGPGTDCVVPPGHSPGDTHASRSGFYELNRIAEQARGYLPNNAWLQTPLLANMNLPPNCNASWNGTAVNFFQSTGNCANTGEIAAIFDHEWGHGMDNNGTNPNISSPGESIADIHSILRLQDSCLGRGTLIGDTCNGYGDPCTVCSGFRELDFARHVSGQPHGITNFIAPNCPAAGQRGPCNRETHCEGMIVAEAGWDIQARDLRAAPFNYDSDTALEATTRLFYLGSQAITNWYQCAGNPPTGDGCNALGGYLNVLAADDDNGNLADGTPHMTAIFAGFNRHQIACPTPAPVNAGCVGGPTTAPIVSAAPIDQGTSLSWAAVPGASRYAIYRTEGPRGCNFGKVKVGETTSLTFTDENLANGNTYFYSVLPIGAAPSCLGRMSACTTVVPVAGANVRTLGAPPITVIGGDNDGILDNCETARLTLRVENTGAVPLTNVRVTAAASATHPLTVPLTPLPATIAASLAPCAQASLNFDVQPHGMAFNQTFEVTLTITADQIAPRTRTLTYRATGVETDFAPVATRTYNFNADLSGWTITSGTFNRVDSGGGNFYLASSTCLDDQCDIARSPVVRLTGTSTLSLIQRYDTETPQPIPYDRANVGIFDVAAGTRTTVSPNGGDPYDLPTGAPNGVCQTTDEAGWSADTDADCTPPPGTTGFQNSTWSAAALNPGGVFTGRSAQISVNFGSDPAANGWGFHFDDVILTNFQESVPDAQTCTQPPPGLNERPGTTRGASRPARATKR